ncbi:MAG: ATP-dependent DNA helicase [Saccharolobus sp.]
MKLREWQEKLSEKVVDALRNNFLVILQAPTGSGKTIFALYTSLKAKSKTIFVVRTHNEYFPVYRELSTHFTDKQYAFLVGKSSACVFSNSDTDPQDIYCKGCELFNAVSLKINDPPAVALSKIKQDAVKFGYCPYYSMLESVKSADVIILTYPYLFVPWLREALDIVWEDYVIVVDEAHNIENIHNIEEKKLSEKIIDLAINQARSQQAKNVLKKLKNKIGKIVHSDEKYILINNIEEIKLSEDETQILKEEYDEIRKNMIINKQISRNYIGSILRFFEIINDSRIKVFSYYNTLVAKYIISSDFVNILNDEKLTFMLMSGTMQPIEYLRNVLGISRKFVYIDVEKVTKTKISGSYECLISIDVSSAYSLRSEQMINRYASYLLKIFYNSKLHILAIFPSYEFMNKVAKLIKNIPYIVENPDISIKEVISKVKNNNKKLLIMGIARGKLSEGIEITSDGRSLISDIVIAGIPYPPVDDYFKLRAQEIMKILKKEYDSELIKIQALIAVKQAIGRGIRSPADNSIIWLLDKRFDNVWWKRELNCLNARKIKL